MCLCYHLVHGYTICMDNTDILLRETDWLFILESKEPRREVKVRKVSTVSNYNIKSLIIY